ncbi:uncharacterized protein LOC123560372 [Mercenaria mercenaria]|uniref:uncharacterized protein LOC123560372 n=1 Tax=Mercenaria mercenaria TaxID=6596 RepID=UPI00234FA6B9|nr:uncharacterized protein LOC123560372 [Mercenaria mercenaria]
MKLAVYILILSVLLIGNANAFIVDCLSICGTISDPVVSLHYGCFCGNHSLNAAQETTLTTNTSTSAATISSTITSSATQTTFTTAAPTTVIQSNSSTIAAQESTLTPNASTSATTISSTAPTTIKSSTKTTTSTTVPTTTGVSTLSMCDYLCSIQMGGAACSCSIPLVPGRK